MKIKEPFRNNVAERLCFFLFQLYEIAPTNT